MAGTFGVVDPVKWVIGGEAESPKPPIAGRSSFEHGWIHGVTRPAGPKRRA